MPALAWKHSSPAKSAATTSKRMQTICHLSVLVHKAGQEIRRPRSLHHLPYGTSATKWRSISWNEFSLRVARVSNALLSIGAKPGEHCCVRTELTRLSLYTDFGAYGVLRCAAYRSTPTSSEQQIQYA